MKAERTPLEAWSEKRTQRKPQRRSKGASPKLLKSSGMAVAQIKDCSDADTKPMAQLVLACPNPACDSTNLALIGSTNECTGEDQRHCFELTHNLVCTSCMTPWRWSLSTNECGQVSVVGGQL